MTTYTGGCLCGAIRFEVTAEPENPHFCSCRQCQKWAGAPTVAWVDVPRAALAYTGPGGEPALFRSSKGTQRGHCPTCGGTLCALDDDGERVYLTTASFDDPDPFAPVSHSFPENAPAWLRVSAEER